ncbi:MFS transporter [Actinoplanes sp. NEAU-A12]|uniref:MFS transporter n=1 Tax=Actinoplanes sandaracinus TaxID=3045177 RepID=A0ABT6WW82_9ACTN|nr:MFS transporter [Actinoplanes sandaracinus]MDI6104008.1 MFS transporter [Actinoplanes sandaracinus]
MSQPLVLRNPAFARVWAAQICSQIAGRMFQAGIVWWVVIEVSEALRGRATGPFMMLASLPAVLLIPVVARALGRYASRTVMRTASLAAAAVTLVLLIWALLAELPLLVPYPAVLLLAVTQCFFDPCLTKSVPELVDSDDIQHATSFEMSTQSIAGLTGAVFGPYLIHLGGPAALIGACAGSYLLSALLIHLAAFRPAPAPVAVPAAQPATDGDLRTRTRPAAVPVQRKLRAVLAELPFIRAVLVCFAAANLFATAGAVVYPLYVRGVFGDSPTTLVLFQSAIGIGMLVGSFSGPHVKGRPATLGPACLAGIGAGLIVPGLVTDRIVIVVALLLVGWCAGVLGVKFVTLFQQTVPAADKPVFFAAMQALMTVTFPVASILFGFLGDVLEPRTLCLIQGIGLLPAALALLAARREPSVPRAAQ